MTGSQNLTFTPTRSPVTSSHVLSLVAAGALLGAGACASSSPSSTPQTGTLSGVAAMGAALAPTVSATPPSPDPRIGLRPGRVVRLASDTTLWVEGTLAAQTAWNMRLLSNTPKAPPFMGVTNSDLAFTGNHVIQGNYNGYMVWDISNPGRPELVTQYVCAASQSDVSVYGNLLFVSGEGQGGRTDCGTDTLPSVSPIRLRGIRIFDISNISNPRYVANVQTCRGSHTHTVVSDPRDNQNVYIYVSGSSGVRSPAELPGCLDAPMDDPGTSRFRIEVIQVPLNAPQNARIVSGARIFEG